MLINRNYEIHQQFEHTNTKQFSTVLAFINQRLNVIWTRIHSFETLVTGVPIFLTQTALFYLGAL